MQPSDADDSVTKGRLTMGIRHKSVVYVRKPEDVPSVEHWAIIKGSSYTTEADERSKRCPGHGYPASTEHYTTYEAYTDFAECEEEVASMVNAKRETFRVLHVMPLSVKTNVTVEVR